MDPTDPLSARALLPFVPARDYALSQAFYRDLGFEQAYRDEQLTEFVLGPCRFYLQNFYEPALASNYVLQLLVEDLEHWWERMQAQQLAARYPGVRLQAPTDKPWGQRTVTLIDPSGVLWYLAQV
ncbi:MAG: glyoxalase [Candidatus Melainabacteria bacterium HGW-Melainabacteria-1]|nr:MAG: glyoxalase [Candidatus Melainabacteria bacterium HGW-Melainabacteria-1]